jgi:hypothetical protein
MQSVEKIAKEINKQFDLPNQSSILYLDTGSGPYYFSARSECRYVAPLVIQRANPNRTQILNLLENQNEYLCIMNYSSEYILADGPIGPAESWFGSDTWQKINIINKINIQYSNVYSGAWQIYRKN